MIICFRGAGRIFHSSFKKWTVTVRIKDWPTDLNIELELEKPPCNILDETFSKISDGRNGSLIRWFFFPGILALNKKECRLRVAIVKNLDGYSWKFTNIYTRLENAKILSPPPWLLVFHFYLCNLEETFVKPHQTVSVNCSIKHVVNEVHF